MKNVRHGIGLADDIHASKMGTREIKNFDTIEALKEFISAPENGRWIGWQWNNNGWEQVSGTDDNLELEEERISELNFESRS